MKKMLAWIGKEIAKLRKAMGREATTICITLVAFLMAIVILFFISSFGVPFFRILPFLLLIVFLFKFTFVKEGTAKIVMEFGAFHKVLLSKKGYIIDPDGNIVPGSTKGLPGGLFFVGIIGVHTIHSRDLKWNKSLPEGNIEERHDKNIDFILAMVDYPYGLKINKAESRDLLNLDVLMTLTARITNPYKAQFAVTDWFNVMVGRISPAVREYISNHTYEEIISDPALKLDKDVMEKLSTPGSGGSPSIIDELKNLYGIEIRALEAVDINPDEAYRKATLSKWQAERDAEKRAGSTIGALMGMIATQTGSTLKEIQDEFKADPEVALKKYEALIKMNKDFIEQQIASDAGALRRYYFQGGGGGMDIIALLGDVLRGGGPSGGPPRGPKPGDPGKSPEEAAKEFFDKHGIWPKWDPLNRGGY